MQIKLRPEAGFRQSQHLTIYPITDHAHPDRGCKIQLTCQLPPESQFGLFFLQGGTHRLLYLTLVQVDNWQIDYTLVIFITDVCTRHISSLKIWITLLKLALLFSLNIDLHDIWLWLEKSDAAFIWYAPSAYVCVIVTTLHTIGFILFISIQNKNFPLFYTHVDIVDTLLSLNIDLHDIWLWLEKSDAALIWYAPSAYVCVLVTTLHAIGFILFISIQNKKFPLIYTHVDIVDTIT